MAIVGLDWLVLFTIIIIVFLAKARTPSELMKSIGPVRKEIEKVCRQLSGTSLALEEHRLIVSAKKLSIPTQGKTKQEISEEIVKAEASA